MNPAPSVAVSRARLRLQRPPVADRVAAIAGTDTEVAILGGGMAGLAAAHALAKLGVLGPTRMDYPTAMGAVRAVARYVGQILAGS